MDLLAHLEAFAAVAERRSFSAAAEQLHIAQPLLSRRIKNLERRLGGELFQRSRRHVQITDLGRLLLPHAQDVIARTGHLLTLADGAHRAALVTVGVPPECEPASLASLIRHAAAQGVAVSVHESPARERAAALQEGRLACALVRTPVESASLVVALGVASAPGAKAATAAATARVVHLDSLRPRRAARTAPPPRLLVLPEDDIALHTDRLARALAAAGLAERSLEIATSASTAVAEVLAGAGRLLCDERFAQRHGLVWSALADRGLHRGYELRVRPRHPRELSAGRLQTWLVPLLVAATGATPAATAQSSHDIGGEDRPRLAAGV